MVTFLKYAFEDRTSYYIGTVSFIWVVSGNVERKLEGAVGNLLETDRDWY